MVFQVNLLIYLYMAICICLLLFNLVYFARDFFKRKRDPEMVRKYMNLPQQKKLYCLMES